MLKSGSLSRTGKCHECLPEHSWDAVMERDCGTWKAAVLCSGDGGCANGKAAAQLTAEVLAGFLAFRFERCLLEAQDALRREVVNLVTKVLTDAAQKAGADPGSFGCTVMAAAMDQQGRWCLFHLGDGTAVGKLYPGSDWLVFSYPQRGLLPGATTLTMNGSMFDNLRFYRHDYPSDRSLFLMSDGAMELLRRVSRLLEKMELGLALPEPENMSEDDCSAAWLIARQKS